MTLKKFNQFLNENLEGSKDISSKKTTGPVTLYRLTSHSVVNLNDPGEFYVNNLQAVNPSLLEKPGKDLFLLTVITDSSNIDEEGSKAEAEKLGNESIIMVKDSALCEVKKVEPYKK